MLDAGCASVRSRLSSTVLRKLEGSVSFGYSFSTRLRTAIKGLLTIGSNLSQTKEFRDLYEDILTKVAEPLEECGVSMSEMSSIIAACYYAAEEIPEMGKGGHHHHHHHAPSASTSTTTTTTTSATNAVGMSSSSSMAATTAYGNSTSANAGLTVGAMGSGNGGGGTGAGGVGGVSGGGNAVGSVFAASNISVRTSDGLTSRTDASVVTVGRESTGTQLTDRNSLIGGNSNAGGGGGGIGYTSGHYSASSSSMHVNQSYVSSTRIQSKAYYMRADWLRFLLFCKLTLTEFMMVDTNRRL